MILKSLPVGELAAKAKEALDAYQKGAETEAEKKAPELQKTGQELSN
jgi:hypothetical protein